MSRPTDDFSTCPAAELAAATRVYFDVDDTVTTEGALLPDAVQAIYAAAELGLSLVAVTGRSAAWGEMLLRLFPLDAVVAETGAICFYYAAQAGASDEGASDEGASDAGATARVVKVLHHEPDADVRAQNQQKRRDIAGAILRDVPEARLASDNIGRLYDTAFDLIEDGAPVSASAARTICAKAAEAGLEVAQSSVHINAWFGRFDKAAMVDRYLREVEGTSLSDAAATLVYLGDSKNDAPMFARAGLSIGVSNVRPHLEALEALGQAPRFCTAGAFGAGFAEVIAALTFAKGGAAAVRTKAVPS